jgi:phosphoglycerate dehydrogenase-like enzyme
MPGNEMKIGISADLFGGRGEAMFGRATLGLLDEAGFSWTVLPPNGGVLSDDAIASFDALFIGSSRVTEATLAADSGRLRLIARNGVGFDAVDTEALSRRGILLTNTPEAVRHGVAASALGFLLALSLRLPLKTALLKEGRWSERGDHPGVGLPGRVLGIVGLGGIGREIVRLIQPFGMRIIASDPMVKPDSLAGTGVELLPLETVMAEADFLVIACYLDASTRHLINAARIALMKPTAFLVNVARGPIVEERALIAALQSGAIAGAGLDVFEKEPPDPANPLLAMDQVIATPHSLCWTDSFVDGVARSAIGGIVDVLKGRLPKHVVNPAALDHPRVGQWLLQER